MLNKERPTILPMSNSTLTLSTLRSATPLRVAIILLSVAMMGLGLVGPTMAQEQERHALVAHVDGMINPVTQRFISRAIDKGEKDGAEVVIVKLDTPGGLLSSTQEIVEDLLSDRVPTAVYVYPSGAHAASAGTFITAAANFAVMSPGTRIGAAAPVAAGGEDIPETLKSKVVEDATALMRLIAEQRNRNSEALEDTVTEPEPKSYTDQEAIELKAVDFVARDVTDLLEQIDGKTVELASGPRTLNTQNLVLREINMSLIEKFLFFLADPNVAFLLLSLGGLGLVIELWTPGLVGPGVVGIICLLLAFLSLGNLPVNWAAVGFILLAAVLVIAELYVSGFGVLGIGAIVSFIFGGLLLFDRFGAPSPTTPSLNVNLWLLGSTAAALTLFGGYFINTVVQARKDAKRTPAPAVSTLTGAIGRVTSDLAPQGTVQLQQEVWTAITDDDTVIQSGKRVRVLNVEGPVLTVAPLEDVGTDTEI